MNTNGKFEIVHEIPENAVAVKEYADSKGCTTSNIYRKLELNKRGKGSPVTYSIVTFKGFNFVIPKP